jgi:hypothetical protein
MDKKKVLFYNDRTANFAVDDEFQKQWRAVAVESMDDAKIEDYLEKQVCQVYHFNFLLVLNIFFHRVFDQCKTMVSRNQLCQSRGRRLISEGRILNPETMITWLMCSRPMMRPNKNNAIYLHIKRIHILFYKLKNDIRLVGVHWFGLFLLHNFRGSDCYSGL